MSGPKKLPTLKEADDKMDDVTERQSTPTKSVDPATMAINSSPETLKTNKLKTATEQYLYNAWKEATCQQSKEKERMNKLENALEKARVEINKLKEMFSSSASSNKQQLSASTAKMHRIILLRIIIIIQHRVGRQKKKW
ncbi:hypothetical protein LSTR_LSTR004163 [Laodelphax striatellus]|uniref:Uncharacterized protein n=1 Tax=Laodelphax striatellus TaxID=195883 RepID=A0A482X8Q8_LAOST|nr:hypothetical protein LSTR_LSTR004163 [Laodelphax striatellus]